MTPYNMEIASIIHQHAALYRHGGLSTDLNILMLCIYGNLSLWRKKEKKREQKESVCERERERERECERD